MFGNNTIVVCGNHTRVVFGKFTSILRGNQINLMWWSNLTFNMNITWTGHIPTLFFWFKLHNVMLHQIAFTKLVSVSLFIWVAVLYEKSRQWKEKIMAEMVATNIVVSWLPKSTLTSTVMLVPKRYAGQTYIAQDRLILSIAILVRI